MSSNLSTIRALEIIATNRITSPREFGYFMWPDNPAWTRPGRSGQGQAKGVGMRLAAGGFLGRLRKAGLISMQYPAVISSKGRGVLELARRLEKFDLRQAMLFTERAIKIADRAYQDWQTKFKSRPLELGEWGCEITSIIRSEPAIFRVGRVLAREPSYPGSTHDFDYEIETLFGYTITWGNCKLIPVSELFE